MGDVSRPAQRRGSPSDGVLLASDERMAVVTSLPDIKRYIRMRQMQPGEPLSPDTAVAVGRAGDGHHGRGSGRYPDV